MVNHKTKIRIAIIVGSVRPDNMTRKAVDLVVDELRQQEHVKVDLIDPANIKLDPAGSAEGPDVKSMQDVVKQATGVVIGSPEYHGSYSAVIKLVIDNLGFPSVLSGKPVSLLGVASGQIGAVKALEHLRSVCSHVGAIVLPGPTSIAGVHKVFDADGHCVDEGVERRVRALAGNLLNYIDNHVCPKMALEALVREKQ